MEILWIIFISIILFITLALVWSILIKGLIVYWRARSALGAKNVIFIYKPLTRSTTIQEANIKLYGNSVHHFFVELKKNPGAKVIVYTTLFMTGTILLDFEMIKNFSMNHQDKIEKLKHGIFRKMIFKGILFSEGDEWKKKRKLLSNFFHFDILKSRQVIFKSIIDETIVDLENKQVDLFKIGKSISARSVIISIFGKRFSEIRFGNNDAAEQIHYIVGNSSKITGSLSYILRSIFLGQITNQKQCFNANQKVLYERIIQFKAICRDYLQKEYERFQKGQQLSQFLTIFFNAKYTQEDIYDAMIQQLIILILAGEDTTTTTIVITLYQLAKDPKNQQTLRKLLKQNEDVHSCKELTSFIYESMRINSLIFFTLFRLIQSDFELVPGYMLRKGQLIFVGMGINMMNPYHFDEPEVFNPDRFNKGLQNNLSFIPFYTGLRNCIGQHMAMIQVRLTVKKILQNYKLSRTSTELKTKVRGFVLNNPIDGNLVKFQKIN